MDPPISEEVIGRGVCGQIYKSTYKNERVAVKKISLMMMTAEEVQGEVNVLKYVSEKCPGLIPLFKGSLQITPSCYIITEFLDGYVNLGDFPTASLPLPELKKIIQTVIEGLQVIHHNNVAHRDVKPENMMIHSKTHHVKYVDFGFAFCEGISFIQRGDAGSPAYMAPETILRGLESTLIGYQRTDRWSLSLSIFEIAYGEDLITMMLENKLSRLLPIHAIKYLEKFYPEWESQKEEIMKPYFQEKITDPDIQRVIRNGLHFSPPLRILESF